MRESFTAMLRASKLSDGGSVIEEEPGGSLTGALTDAAFPLFLFLVVFEAFFSVGHRQPCNTQSI